MWYCTVQYTHARRLDGLVPPLDPRERALVVTAFISLPRNATKHGYQSLRHSLKVPADYYMYCSDALQCAQMQESRRPVDARGWSSAVQQLTYEQLVRSLAQRSDVSVDALLAAARSSVHRAPGWGGHCPSAEIILIWLAKPLLVELAMRVHPTRRLFAWVDAGLTPYASKDPPPPPWDAMSTIYETLSVLNGALAIRRQVGACHNRRRLTPLNRTCPIGTWLFGSPYAWRAVSELFYARSHELVASLASWPRVGGGRALMLCLDQDVMQDVVERAPPHTFVEVETDDQYGWKNARLVSVARSGDGWLDRCAAAQSNPALAFASAKRILLFRPLGGLGNQILGTVSAILLACLSSRTLFLENATQGIFTPAAFTLRWQSRRPTLVSASDASTGGGAEVHLSAYAGGALGNHLRLVRAAQLLPDATARVVRVDSDQYFLKSLLVNPHHAAAMGDACPQPERCFERLFTRFFAPSPAVMARLATIDRDRPLGHCDLGIHVRSGTTFSAAGQAEGVRRAASCARHLLRGSEGAAPPMATVFVAAGVASLHHDLAAAIEAETRTAIRVAVVRQTHAGAAHTSKVEKNLRSWGNAIFKYGDDDMVFAAVDLLALSECDALIGTRHSTFSYVAQALRSRRQARIYDEWGNGPLAAGAPMPQCVLYNFTQPIFQNWRRYGNVRGHLGRNAGELESERARIVFAGERELPVKAH